MPLPVRGGAEPTGRSRGPGRGDRWVGTAPRVGSEGHDLAPRCAAGAPVPVSVLDDLDGDERRRLRPGPSPDRVEPMLATLVPRCFSDEGWIFERKLDGERSVARRHGDGVHLWSRRHRRQDPSYPEIVDALAAQEADDFVVDGEVVAFDGNVTSFSRLQGRMQLSDPDRARATGVAVFLYVFDLLHVDGHDVTRLPLRRRKQLLRWLFRWDDPLRYTPHRNASGEAYHQEACRRGWEGIIAKEAASPYRSGRSRSWCKCKCSRRQELVIGGFTEPAGGRQGFGALLVGHYDGDRLRYAGKVGTGFDDDALARLGARLRQLEQPSSPFDDAGAGGRGVHFVAPELVGEVAFAEWTSAGRLRHPRFLGLRRDKDPRAVVREAPGPPG